LHALGCVSRNELLGVFRDLDEAAARWLAERRAAASPTGAG
jgi:hypothetical protein